MISLERPMAKAEADAWEAGLRIEWAALMQEHRAPKSLLRDVYEKGRQAASRGEYIIYAESDASPAELGIEHEIDKLEDKYGERQLSDVDGARLAALQDALAEHRGERPERRRELEPSFSETASDYLKWWAMQDGLKDSNTRQQKEATYRLFGGFIGDRPLLEVRKADAVEFMDALRSLNPHWGKSGKAKHMSWQEVQREFGAHSRGLSASSLNRHAQTFSELWRWGEDRERCHGRNPFRNLRQRLQPGKNQQSYLPWTHDELKALFNPPPRRADVTELMVVALHTGMRINEIAALTFSQIKQEDGVHFIDVEDAKTPAGNRQIPLHPRLAWLAELEGKPEDRVWPNPHYW